LGSVPVAVSKRLVAEVLAVYSHPFSNQIVINKGSNDGVVAQQPLIDDLGVLGQIVSVGPTSSRALLISDTTHAISLRVERNGDHVVAEGLGQSDEVKLMHSAQRRYSARRQADHLGFGRYFPRRLSGG
jgi:rod shape-determining protein MreC